MDPLQRAQPTDRPVPNRTIMRRAIYSIIRRVLMQRLAQQQQPRRAQKRAKEPRTPTSRRRVSTRPNDGRPCSSLTCSRTSSTDARARRRNIKIRRLWNNGWGQGRPSGVHHLAASQARGTGLEGEGEGRQRDEQLRQGIRERVESTEYSHWHTLHNKATLKYVHATMGATDDGNGHGLDNDLRDEALS